MGEISKGTIIDHYEIVDTLGEGGMGEVFLAHDRNLDRKVAIKTLVSNKDNLKLQKRFENEAKILASLNHANIVAVYNYGVFEGTSYMVMEYIEGQNLSQVLKSRGFGIGEAIESLLQMVDGILEAHSQGVLHRDIKSANIVLDKTGRIKVVDFGISKDFKQEDPNLTDMGKVIGTTNYMAPEILIGQRPSTRSDIFSLGIVLFEMLQGINPFSASTRYETMENIRKLDPKLSSEVSRIVPPILEKILYKMLSKDPDDRYQNLSEIKDHLTEIDLQSIPNDLMSAKRPEVMILNEQKIRLKLLSQGFATREIGIILSLAAQIQEKNEPLADKTEILDGKIEEKISLSPDALEKAVSKFKIARNKISSSHENGFISELTNVIGTQVESWSTKTYALMGSSLLMIVIAAFFLIPERSPVLSLNAPAPLYHLPEGAKWKEQSRLVDATSGETLQNTVRQISVKKNDHGEKITETIDIKSGARAISSLPVNTFVPSNSYETVAGDQGHQVILGDYESIFPLKTGNSMIFSAKGKSKWDGSFGYTKKCEVIGQEIVHLQIGNFPTWVVNCVNAKHKVSSSYRKFYYSPLHGYFIKGEAQWDTQNRSVIETREWIDDSQVPRLSY